MSNKEKLIKLLKDNGVSEIRYTEGADLNAERPNVDFLLIVTYDKKFIYDIYRIYTNDGDPDEDQSICVYAIEEGSPLLYGFKSYCAEVLYVK